VVVDAHLYGALCGFIVGGILSWRAAIIRLRSRAAKP
jgi:membrane associated rhomboid family serine protease